MMLEIGDSMCGVGDCSRPLLPANIYGHDHGLDVGCDVIVPTPTTPEMIRKEKRQDNDELVLY